MATSLSAFGRRVASLSPRGDEGNLSFPEKDAFLLPSFSTEKGVCLFFFFFFLRLGRCCTRAESALPGERGKGREKANGIFNRCLAFSPRFSSRFSHLSQIFPLRSRNTFERVLLISTRKSCSNHQDSRIYISLDNIIGGDRSKSSKQHTERAYERVYISQETQYNFIRLETNNLLVRFLLKYK